MSEANLLYETEENGNRVLYFGNLKMTIHKPGEGPPLQKPRQEPEVVEESTVHNHLHSVTEEDEDDSGPSSTSRRPITDFIPRRNDFFTINLTNASNVSNWQKWIEEALPNHYFWRPEWVTEPKSDEGIVHVWTKHGWQHFPTDEEIVMMMVFNGFEKFGYKSDDDDMKALVFAPAQELPPVDLRNRVAGVRTKSAPGKNEKFEWGSLSR